MFAVSLSEKSVNWLFSSLQSFQLWSGLLNFAKLPADVDEADCGFTVSVSSTGGKCAYSGKVVPSFIPGDRSPWAPAGEKCLIGRYVTT